MKKKGTRGPEGWSFSFTSGKEERKEERERREKKIVGDKKKKPTPPTRLENPTLFKKKGKKTKCLGETSTQHMWIRYFLLVYLLSAEKRRNGFIEKPKEGMGGGSGLTCF